MVKCAVTGVVLLLFCGAVEARQVSRNAIAALPRGEAVFVSGTPAFDAKADTLVPANTGTEVDGLNRDDVKETETTFYGPRTSEQTGGETGGHAGSEAEEWDMAMFDRFLAASPKYRRTPLSERPRLFREFQEWRRTQR